MTDGDGGTNRRRALKTWQGWLLLAAAAALVPLLFIWYID